MFISRAKRRQGSLVDVSLGLGRLAIVAAAMACSAGGSASAQTVTNVPLNGFVAESWMRATASYGAGPPAVLTVSQTSSGYRWNVGFYTDGGSNPEVFNALVAGANNPGSFIRFEGRFSQSLMQGPNPTFLGINTFCQTFSPSWGGDNFPQNFNMAILGSDQFPIGGGLVDVPFSFDLPIEAFTSTTTKPASGTGKYFINPASTGAKFGLGTNSDNGALPGFYLDSVSISVVPEPSTWLMAVGGLGCAAWGACRLRKRA